MKALCFSLLFLAACAPDLRTDFPFDGALPGTDHVVSTTGADGLVSSTVDATNKMSFVYFDLDTGKELAAGDALDQGTWDLTFQRFKVSSNGGGGGPGPVRVAVIKNGQFGLMTQAPATGYQQDASEPVFNGVEGGWYFYDLGVHKLITRTDLFYVVQSTEGRYFKIQMGNYYDAQGTAGRLSFQWKEVAAP